MDEIFPPFIISSIKAYRGAHAKELLIHREELYETSTFKERKLAALVASKVYYHLGEYDESMLFALGAGDLFDITAGGEYVETIICTKLLFE